MRGAESKTCGGRSWDITGCVLRRADHFMVREKFLEKVKAGEAGEKLSRQDICFLLTTQETQEQDILLKASDRVRQEFLGDEIHLRAVVEFSNICVQNCLYCGLRRDNRELVRYRMTLAEIVSATQEAAAMGFKTAVLQSGEDPWFTRERLSDLIREIKETTGLALTLSVGERTYQDYRDWREAGADRYLLKFETSSPLLYKYLRGGLELTHRLNALNWLKELGYEVGSGNMVGLPGQSDEDLATDIEFFRQYDYDMIGIGPFIAHPQTPLAGARNGEFEKTLRVLAITRILLRDTNLPATTALGVLQEDGRWKALSAGANVFMPDVTPITYRRHYQIYPGKAQISASEEAIANRAVSLGRRISAGSGFRSHSHKSSGPNS